MKYYRCFGIFFNSVIVAVSLLLLGSLLSPMISWASGPISVDDSVETLPPSPVTTAQIETAATGTNEGFEGIWPTTSWQVIDLSVNDGGEYLWGKRNCHPRKGSFSGWAIGGGAQGSALSCTADYPNNVHSWAIYGPFDLSNAGAASLTFHLWGRTEGATGCPFDYLFVGSSINDINYQGSRYCGDWTSGDAGNGYSKRTLDLSNRLGQSQVWIAFVFSSDVIVTDSGVMIDDVSLQASNSSHVYLPIILHSPPSPPDGSWAGMTNLGRPVSFTVINQGTGWSNFKLETTAIAGPCNVTLTETFFGPGPITKNQFSSSSSTFSFSGNLNSRTAASGTYAFVNESVPGCGSFSQSGTWTANRQ